MDVILDTNIYVDDFKMQKTQFQELFKYLERTGASLVLPSVIRMEVVQKYRQVISQGLKELERAWGGLRGRAISELDEFLSPINIDSEVSTFEENLALPAPKVRGVLYEDYSGVEVGEIARRGIERVRPASDAGEELRDVILWLMVLEYAKKHEGGVGFISADRTFQGDGGLLHPTLASDVSHIGAAVFYYSSISGFITSHSLETEDLTEESFHSLVGPGALDKETVRFLGQSAEFGGAVQAVVVDSLHLAKGRRYKVGDNAFYVEAVLSATARVKVREFTNVFVMPPAPGVQPLVTATRRAGNAPFDVWANLRVNNAGVVSGWEMDSVPFYGDPNYVIPSYLTPFKQGPYSARPVFNPSVSYVDTKGVETLYRCEMELDVSARIAEGRLIALQVDRLRINDRKCVPDVGLLDKTPPNAT